MLIVKILNRLYERVKNSDDKAIVIKEAIDAIQDTMKKDMQDTIDTILKYHYSPIKFWVDITLNEIKKVINKGIEE